MYRNAYQRGLLTIFFGGGANPLATWDTTIKDGYITRFLDQEIKSMVLEIRGNNVTTTYITCPKGKQVLGIAMPFLIMVVRNLKRYFTFEVTILDDTGTRRRFRVSNFQSTTQILPLCTVMPIALSDGWNQIQFNLAEFTRRAYKKQFIEVQKVKINANIRIRRIYFAERLLPEDQLPAEYKFFLPISSKGKKPTKEDIKAEGRLSTSSVKKVSSIDKGQEVGEDGEALAADEAIKEEGVVEEQGAEGEEKPTEGEEGAPPGEEGAVVEETQVEGEAAEAPAGEVVEGEQAVADEAAKEGDGAIKGSPEGAPGQEETQAEAEPPQAEESAAPAEAPEPVEEPAGEAGEPDAEPAEAAEAEA